MSAVALSQAEAPAHHEGGWWRHFREHFAQEWASALLVASIITIANHQFHWLRSFETYTFLTLGQLTSVSLAGGVKEHRAVIVEIDDAEFESLFQETTPLDREQLANRLATIYAAKPDIVVVDLDISPTYQPVPEHAPKSRMPPLTAGEQKLYELIKDQAKEHGIATVLLEPFKPAGTKLRNWREAWKAYMTSDKTGRIVFADGEVPVRYGVHSELSTRDDAIVKTVEKLIRPTQGTSGTEERARKLDPRQLLKGTSIVPLGTERSEDALRIKIEHELDVAQAFDRGARRVVFFGAAFGSQDLFLTAVGEIYGVETHAAGYVSDIVKENHFFDFVLDFVIAVLFGLAIAFFWRKYFDARLSDDRTVRELAKLWIIALVISVLLMVVVLSFTSLLLLAAFGIWLSPIPIAIGMMFDSFVSGSVDQATHKFKAMRRELIERYTQPPLARPDQSVSMSAPRSQKLAYWGARYLPRVLGGDICGHLLAQKRGAAALLCLWTVIWVSTAAWAAHLAYTAH